MCYKLFVIFQGEYQNITFTVIECKCYSTDHPQGGFEVPDKLISITKTSEKALEAINRKLQESTLSIQVGIIEDDTTGIKCSGGTPTGKASSEEQHDA